MDVNLKTAGKNYHNRLKYGIFIINSFSFFRNPVSRIFQPPGRNSDACTGTFKWITSGTSSGKIIYYNLFNAFTMYRTKDVVRTDGWL